MNVKGLTDLTNLMPKSQGFMHSGIAVDASGTIFVAHQEGHALVEIKPDGTNRVLPLPFAELHGISLASYEDQIVVTNPGWRMEITAPETYEPTWTDSCVAFINKQTGAIERTLVQPEIAQYETKVWRPTSVTVDRMPGGTGAIWVADGYGENLVHRFDKDGNFEFSIDGTESGAHFDCPHGILLVRDGSKVEVFVADRTNHRIVVLNEHGEYLRNFGIEFLDSPSGFAQIGDDLYISELRGGVAHFKLNGQYIGTLEDHRVREHTEPEWPNLPGDGPNKLLAPLIPVDGFNSPHGITAHNGELYLTEWVIGGRLVRISL